MFTIISSLQSLAKVIVVLLLVVIGYRAWEIVLPARPILAPEPRVAIDEAIQVRARQVVAQAPAGTPVAVLQLEGDQTLYVTDHLREAIAGFGTVTVIDKPLEDRVRAAVGVTPAAYPTAEAAIMRGKELDAALVVFGRVTMDVGADWLRAGVSVEMLDVASGRKIPLMIEELKPERSAQSVLGAAVDAAGGLSWSLVRRWAAWAVVCLALPLVSVGFLRATVRRESTGRNAVVLGSLALACVLLYVVFVGLGAGLAWSWGVAGVSIALAVAYQWLMMAMVARSAE